MPQFPDSGDAARALILGAMIHGLSRRGRVLGAVGIPLLYAAGAVILGVVMPRLEERFLPGLNAHVSVGAAMSLLSAIASGMLPSRASSSRWPS